MIPCTVTAGRVRYSGIFASTCAAVLDAMTRFPAARRISVRSDKP